MTHTHMVHACAQACFSMSLACTMSLRWIRESPIHMVSTKMNQQARKQAPRPSPMALQLARVSGTMAAPQKAGKKRWAPSLIVT